LGYARDIGWRALRDLSYVSMVDSDVLVDKRFFPEAIKLMEYDKGLGALAGKLKPECSERGLAAKFQVKNLAITLHHKEAVYPMTVPAVHTAFTLFRKDALEKVNGFSHNFSLAKEDSDISFKLRKAGYRLSLLNYFARHLETGQRFWNLNFRYGRSYVIIGKKYPEYSPLWSRKNMILLAISLQPFAEPIIIAWYFRRYINEVRISGKEAFELSIMETARQAMRSLGMLHEVIRQAF
ncbi:MAG: glycosyltransferase family 2 protein, partial [Conexivisphaerales archaeon]